MRMLSPEERRLIVAILALLLLGALVDAYRSRSTERSVPKAVLPDATQAAKPAPRE